MGQGNSRSQPDFPVQKYVKPGLSQEEVIDLWNVFQEFGPVNGFISVDQIKQRYQHSGDKKKFDQLLGNQQQLDFDNFYNIMGQDIIDKKNKYGKDVEFDYNPQGNIQCEFCPSYQAR